MQDFTPISTESDNLQLWAFPALPPLSSDISRLPCIFSRLNFIHNSRQRCWKVPTVCTLLMFVWFTEAVACMWLLIYNDSWRREFIFFLGGGGVKELTKIFYPALCSDKTCPYNIWVSIRQIIIFRAWSTTKSTSKRQDFCLAQVCHTVLYFEVFPVLLEGGVL